MSDSDLETGFERTTLDRIKQQRWRGTYTYTPAVPVVAAKASGKYRLLPDLDPETLEPRPYVENGKFTWLALARGVSMLGLWLPDLSIRTTYSFWIDPADMERYVPELEEAGDDKQRRSLIANRCPYSCLYYRLRGSDSEPTAPPEWALLADRDSWQQLLGSVLGIKRPLFAAPLPSPQVHAIIRAHVLQNKSLDFTEDDNPGGLYPAAIELGLSATRNLFAENGPFLKKVEVPTTDREEDLYTARSIIAPGEGKIVELVMHTVQQKGGQSFPEHRLRIVDQTLPKSLAEMQAEWHPFEQPAGGRQQILRRLTCREQVGVMMKAFGAEAADFCFRDTPYEELLPEGIRGAFGRYASEQPLSVGKWLGQQVAQLENWRREERPREETSATSGRVEKILKQAAQQAQEARQAEGSEPSQGVQGQLEELLETPPREDPGPAPETKPAAPGGVHNDDRIAELQRAIQKLQDEKE